ncbi:MAG: FAD-dependent oxidoreductase [Robiginitomaculum sp.]|nr:MAG: FAD-dependent oxidoreductase [Robiginitomaculum sp.]
MGQSNIPVYKQKTYVMPPELSGGKPKKHAFVIVGSGPVGLVLALDLARKGHDVCILTAFDFIASGSKGICYSKQSLDILDRLGVGERVIEKGVIWNVGKVFWGDQKQPIYQFDMLPLKDQKNPGFINIQQYYLEDYLVDALEALDNVDIRWGNTVTDIEVRKNDATLSVTTRDGDYKLEADYVLACDGANSTIRQCMGLDFQGRIFEDNFLIADVKFKHEFPSERWFWFDPPFNRGRTALLHKQPDDVWRIDFQLGWNIDRKEAVKTENVAPYVKALLGDDVEYEDDWLSIYTFQCRRMERFLHTPVIFIGDCAHLVSPFGARGANAGLSDAENIAWKLDMVLKNNAPKSLLESYNVERVMGSDENILNSSRSTDFMTPKSKVSTAFRDAVLELADKYEFARPFVNSGRLSTPTPYHETPLSTPDRDEFKHGPKPGFPCPDAPLPMGRDIKWLLENLGDEFVVLQFGETSPKSELKTICVPATGLAAERYGAEIGTTYLIRPDQVVAARWKNASAKDINTAYEQAISRAGAQEVAA